jgi:hypothetical protein
MGTKPVVAYRHGQAAIVEALGAFGAQGERHTPWMKARDLARSVGAADETDPQFQANVQALYEAGSIRLMSGRQARSRHHNRPATYGDGYPCLPLQRKRGLGAVKHPIPFVRPVVCGRRGP